MDNNKQEKLRDFVNKEVYCSQTMLIDELLKNGTLDYGDIVNYYANLDEEVDEAIKDIMADDDSLSEEEAEKQAIDDLKADQLPQEIFEWWVVSDFLAGRLEANDEPILKSDFGTWWGRTCNGQAILLDGVIEKIFDSL